MVTTDITVAHDLFAYLSIQTSSPELLLIFIKTQYSLSLLAQSDVTVGNTKDFTAVPQLLSPYQSLLFIIPYGQKYDHRHLKCP
jgi:hypothetical protein